MTYRGNIPSEEIREDFRKLMVASAPQTMLYALYFANKRGDEKLLNKIYGIVEHVVTKYNMTTNTIMSDLDMGLANNYYLDPASTSEIFDEAVAELEAEEGN